MTTTVPPAEGWIKRVVHSRDNFRCRYCGVRTSHKHKNRPYSRTVDHVIPRSKGGRTNIINLVTCCKKCNDEKKSFTLAEMGYKMLPTPKHTPEEIDKWIRRNWPDRCIHCEKRARQHERPPYHGGPRKCRTGDTLYMARSHHDFLLEQNRLSEVEWSHDRHAATPHAT